MMQLKTITFPQDEHTYASVSWDELHQLTFEVARQMLEKGIQVDRIVTLAKGGWTMTRSLVDFLDVQHVASIGVRFYLGINQRLDKPEVYQDIPVSVKGEKVLLFDDIADTGASFLFAKQYLEKHGVLQVFTASTLYKPHSQFKPDFYGDTTEDWVLFPYDVAQTVTEFARKWFAQGLEKEEVFNRMVEFGFDSNIINYYLERVALD